MAHQEPGTGGTTWAHAPAITQAERGMWQRQAATMLEYLVYQHAALPAITWYLTRAGNLHGHVGSEVPPGERRKVFTAWSMAVGLEPCTEVPATGSALVQADGQANWGSVAVSVTASVRPAGSGEEIPDAEPKTGKPPVLATCDVVPAVEFLAQAVSCYEHIDAVTWRVRPSGELTALVSIPGSPRQAGALFRQWREALGLGRPQVTAFHDGAGLHAQGYCLGNVHVTLEATVMRTRPGHAAARSPEAARGNGVPRPGSRAGRAPERPGAAPEAGATRPLRHPLARGIPRHGPTPRPS